MNILAIYKSLDAAGYYMLGELSQREGFNIYIAIASEADRPRVKGNCIAVKIPEIKSKYSRPAIKELRKIIKQYDIDIAYAIATSALSSVILASKGNKKIKIVGYSGADTKVSRLDITHYLGWLNPRVDHIVCVAPHVKAVLERRVNPDKLTVIRKPYDVAWIEDEYRNPREVEGIPADALKVINIASSKGRSSKGIKYIVEAATILNDPSIHFILVGSYDDKVYKMAQKSPAKDRIHFLGQRKDAKYLLAKQDVFLLSSLIDAWPRVVREAMSCELPCIVTAIPGPKAMVVEGETGLIVEPASGQAIADAVRWMKENEGQRKEFGKRGRQRIIDDFPPAPYVDAYDRFFRELMES